MSPFRSHARMSLLVAAVGLGLPPALPTSARPKVEPPAEVRIAPGPFRADRSITDARFSPDGRRIVGLAGATRGRR